jgi:tRNA-dihydrouridine synthase B
MAGITETVFRSLCRQAGADIVVSEMVSAEGIFRGSRNTRELIHTESIEQPVGIQLFGCNPDRLAYAARYVEQNARPAFIDLNCGCPVAKVVRKNGGSALLKDARLFEAVLSAMVRAVQTPVTVKIRSGWFEHQWVDIEYARIAQNCGAAAITVHPRSKTMGFRGRAYWDRIAAVKAAVDIAVIGSGDVCGGEAALAMFEQTGCDGVMIGRAALGRPWIFAEARAMLNGAGMQSIDAKSRCSIVQQHVRRYRKLYGETRAAREMKKHAAWYIKGLAGASALRRKIFACSSTNGLEELLTQYFTI